MTNVSTRCFAVAPAHSDYAGPSYCYLDTGHNHDHQARNVNPPGHLIITRHWRVSEFEKILENPEFAKIWDNYICTVFPKGLNTANVQAAGLIAFALGLWDGTTLQDQYGWAGAIVDHANQICRRAGLLTGG